MAGEAEMEDSGDGVDELRRSEMELEAKRAWVAARREGGM
jgi:hypothetical protein